MVAQERMGRRQIRKILAEGCEACLPLTTLDFGRGFFLCVFCEQVLEAHGLKPISLRPKEVMLKNNSLRSFLSPAVFAQTRRTKSRLFSESFPWSHPACPLQCFGLEIVLRISILGGHTDCEKPKHGSQARFGASHLKQAMHEYARKGRT